MEQTDSCALLSCRRIGIVIRRLLSSFRWYPGFLLLCRCWIRFSFFVSIASPSPVANFFSSRKVGRKTTTRATSLSRSPSSLPCYTPFLFTSLCFVLPMLFLFLVLSSPSYLRDPRSFRQRNRRLVFFFFSSVLCSYP